MSSPTKPPSLLSSSSVPQSELSVSFTPKKLLEPEAPLVTDLKLSSPLVVPDSLRSKRKDTKQLFTDAEIEKMAKSDFNKALALLIKKMPGLIDPQKSPPKNCYSLSEKIFGDMTSRDYINKYKDSKDLGASICIVKWLLYLDKIPPRVIKAMHLALGKQCVDFKKPLALSPRDPKAKVIKIGFYGNAFGLTSESRFIYGIIQGLIKHHSDKVEICCLDSKAMNVKGKPLASKNKEIFGNLYGKLDQDKINYRFLGDKDIKERAKEIAKLNLDILVELEGFSYPDVIYTTLYKPARKIVSYLGYPHITGFPQIDYRLVSDLSDKEEDEKLKREGEKLIHLKNSFLCFSPNDTLSFPKIEAEPPCIENGYITFGCTNNPAKITSTYLNHVKRLLETHSKSKIVFKFAQIDKEFLEGLIKEAGIDLKRVIIIDGSRIGMEQHLESYNSIDIMLDTFPYNGTTTNVDCFMMGLPVVAYEGEHHVARVTSMFHQVVTGDSKGELNLAEDLIAHNKEEYFKKIDALVKAPDKLRAYRKHLRNQFLKSELCNEKIFAERLMEAFEKIVKDEI